MISWHIILTVAKYEAKVLWRSWFFRIFSLLSLTILVLLDVAQFATPFAQWMNRGMAASVPYMNIILLNLVQAIIAVFMASEFLKFDRRLDTAEAVYTRSMTNTDYIIGKMIGILGVFLGLNIAVLIVSFVFNFFFTEVTPVPALYAIYPLLLSLPTLLFMFGLSFLVMSIVRNQAITFLLLLGYIAGTLFFLGGKSHAIFDVMGLHVPFMYSDFVGFGDMTPVLMQRGMYVLLGLGFILATALCIHRLIQSAAVRAATAVLAAGLLCSGLFLGSVYLHGFSAGEKLRAEARDLNREAAKAPAVTLDSCDLTVAHKGGEIEASARLSFTNAGSGALDNYTFSLNPGLKVTAVSRGSEKLTFERRLHLLTVKASTPLAPGAADSLTVTYRGSIDERICYADLPETDRGAEFRFWVYAIDRRYSFLTPDFALLTAENLWYPTAGAPYGSAFPDMGKRDFVRFTLDVKTLKGLTAISQGAVTKPAPGEFVFRPESALPRLSLVIGKYTDRTISSDGIEYHLYVRPGHDYFTPYFKKLKSQLPELLKTAMQTTETQLNLTYAFPRLSLVEVPIQFSSHERIWRADQETLQPEQALLPEKGVLLRGADFKMSSYFMTRGGRGGGGGGGGRGGASGQSQTDEEKQSNLFRMFYQFTFSGSMPNMRNMARGFAARGSGVNQLQRMAFSISGATSVEGDYNLFPQFYSFANHIRSTQCPVLDAALEQYLKSTTSRNFQGFRFGQGVTADEQANVLLETKSLPEILSDPAQRDVASDVMRIKGSYLFTTLQALAGAKDFKTYLSDFLVNNIFKDTDDTALLAGLRDRFGTDFTPFVEGWYSLKGVPSYVITGFRCTEVVEGDRTRYPVALTISNIGKVDGTVSISAITGGGGGGAGGQRSGGQSGGGGGGMFGMFGGGSDDNTRYIMVKAGQSKELGMVLDSAPRRVTVNTFISRNLPSSISKTFAKPEKGSAADIFDGERVLESPPQLTQPGEIIVDNEDAGFKTEAKVKESFLKRFLKKGEDTDTQGYISMQFRNNPPATWRPAIMDNFYGVERRSAHFIRSGSGESRAIWEASIPENGTWAVYCYCSSPRMFMGRPGGGGGGGGQQGRQGQQGQQQGQQRQQGGQNMIAEFHFIVHHDDGEAEVIQEMQDVPEGWVQIGTYHLSAGPARVELTDKTKGRVVFADAIKWVKQQDSGQGKKQ